METTAISKKSSVKKKTSKSKSKITKKTTALKEKPQVKKIVKSKNNDTVNDAVSDTVKNKLNKKDIIKSEPKKLKSVFFDDLLDKSFGKKGTEERSRAELLLTERLDELFNEVKNKLKQEKEPKTILEEKNIVEPVLPKGIIPADFVPENKNADNKENLPSRPIQLYREYIVHQGAEFLNGELKVQENDTKIARTKDTEYMIYKNIGSTNAFTTPFKCHDLAEAELFLDELNAYENKIKNTKMENEPKQEMPIQEMPKQEVISEEQKKEIINKYEGLPLQEVDIKELIKAAGDAPTTNNPIANQVAQNNFSNAQSLSQMESYGETIAGLINQKPWMKMSTNEVNRLLSNQCSKLYSYLLKNDGKGYYVEISQGNVKTRAPKDPNSFLNVA